MLWFGALAGAIVLSIVALIYHLDQMFFVAVTLGAAPWVSWLLSSRGMAQVRAALQSAGAMRLSVGEERTLRVMLYNHGRLPRILCRAALRLPAGLQAVREQSLQADTLAPGATAHLDVRFRGARRGCYQISEAEIRTTDQLGVFEFPALVPDVSVGVTVWPRRVPVTTSGWLLDSASRAGSEQTAAHRRGTGLEFYGVREWSPGDELRRVHWPSTARRGELTVVEFERQSSRSLTLIIDLGVGRHSGSGDLSTLEWCVSFAATLACLTVEHGGTTGLIACGAKDHGLSLRDGILEVEAMLDRLAEVDEGATAPLDRIVARRQAEVPIAGAVILTPRLDEQVIRAATHIRRAGGEAAVLVVDAGAGDQRDQRVDVPWRRFRPGVDDPVAVLQGGPA
jgi:uncharacterized protein (DUF58 family)